MTKTKTPTYEVTVWFATEHEVTLRGNELPRDTTPTGLDVTQFQLSYCTLTTDDLHRALDHFARKEHAEWEDRDLVYRGLVGYGDGWWKAPDASLWYRVTEKR